MITTHRAKSGVRPLVLPLILSLAACAGPRSGMAARSGAMSVMVGGSDSNSGNSAASNNSAAGSGDSAKSSGDSAKSSGNSADSSNGSSQNSQNSSNGSSRTSSEQTTAQLSPILSTTLLGGTVVGVGFLIWGSVAAAAPAAAVVAPAAAQLFLRSNAHQLEQDLALGAGRSIEDLAALAEIRPEHLPRFSRLLCEHREELLGLARPSVLTPERAAEFMHRVGGLAATDSSLARDGHDFLARHPGT